MTTVITRLFETSDGGSIAMDALRNQGFGESALDLIESGANARDAMATAQVPEAAIDAYTERMSGNNTLLAVRAPFGMAGKAKQTLRQFHTIDVQLESEDAYVGYRQAPDYHLSVFRSRKKFLTGNGPMPHGPVFTPYGIPILSQNQRAKSKAGSWLVTDGMMPVLARYKPKNRTIGHKKMLAGSVMEPSRKLRTTREKTPFSNRLGLPLLTARD